jgi:hypothetical protein
MATVDVGRVTRSSSPGSLVVLIGAVGFVASCFLPYTEYDAPAGVNGTLSLFRLTTAIPQSAAAKLGGYLHLFAGVVAIIVICIAGLRGARRWTAPALLGASIVWSVTWIGTLLTGSSFFSTLRFGFWLLLLTVLVVLAGAVTAVISTRGVAGSPAANESSPRP